MANLLASYADTVSALATADDVRAYTFATPNCTSSADAREAAYDNIFNVLNPADLVPQLPLASWGYERYGRDVWLPGEGDASFSDLEGAMGESYLRSMGTESPVEPGDRVVVERFAERIGERAGSFDELVSPAGLVELVGAVAQVDVVHLLANHYPNTYVAWLDVAGAEDLTFS